MSWLKQAMLQANKPKESVIAILRKNLGGMQQGRDRSEVHASDITKPHFCPRLWAFLDLKAVKSQPEFVPTAMAVTYDMGLETERKIVEEWAGDATIGNWRCLRCFENRTMSPKPNGFCKDGQKHIWRYVQLKLEALEYAVTGSVDWVVNVGTARWLFVELKTLNPTDFEKIVAPQSEHRLRTALYLKIAAESEHPYKDKFNLLEGRVLYVSRGYGKKNDEWNEILPFKEFTVSRDDATIKPCLQKARALKMFRLEGAMPSGICSTALDPLAKKCGCCQLCFSGQFPAVIQWETL